MNGHGAAIAGNPWLSQTVEIDAIVPEMPDVATYQLRFVDASRHERYQFRPGQFNMLYLPGVARSPSASAPEAPGERGTTQFVPPETSPRSCALGSGRVARVTRSLRFALATRGLPRRGSPARGWRHRPGAVASGFKCLPGSSARVRPYHAALWRAVAGYVTL